MSTLQLWEQVEVAELRKFFNHFQVDCVFDVGANRGQYRDLLREHVGFKGLIISFEPIPVAIAHMRQRMAGDANWVVLQMALDRIPGRNTFNVMMNDKFSSFKQPSISDFSRLESHNTVSQAIDVEKSTIAVQFPQLKERHAFKRPFLKMDTQGNDIDVVEGTGERISDFVGLQSELSVRKLYHSTFYYYESLAYYQAKGFLLSALFANNGGHFPDLVEIDCLMYRSLPEH